MAPEPVAEAVVALPAPALRAWVDRFVGYRMAGFPPGVHHGLPSRHLTFIVSIGEPIDVVAQTDPAQAPDRYRTVLSGLQASSARIAHSGTQEGVAVELTPLGCRALLGLPAAALWNLSLESAAVLGPAGDELWERVQGAPTWPERFAACDAVLGRLLDPRPGPAPEVARAWDRIVATGGAVPVAALAAEVGWSRQHLARRFGAELGLGPKLAARVVRLERAARLLPGRGAGGVADVAARCGYYDQAHLDRDFRELVGTSPTAWLAAELPSVQAGDAGPVVG